MTHLKDFTSSIQRQKDLDPMMLRWLYGTREIESRLSQQIVNLCSRYEKIPGNAVPSFADLLIEVLQEGDLEEELSPASRLAKKISTFADFLEESDNPAYESKAQAIRKAMSDRAHTEE